MKKIRFVKIKCQHAYSSFLFPIFSIITSGDSGKIRSSSCSTFVLKTIFHLLSSGETQQKPKATPIPKSEATDYVLFLQLIMITKIFFERYQQRDEEETKFFLGPSRERFSHTHTKLLMHFYRHNANTYPISPQTTAHNNDT